MSTASDLEVLRRFGAARRTLAALAAEHDETELMRRLKAEGVEVNVLAEAAGVTRQMVLLRTKGVRVGENARPEACA